VPRLELADAPPSQPSLVGGMRSFRTWFPLRPTRSGDPATTLARIVQATQCGR